MNKNIYKWYSIPAILCLLLAVIVVWIYFFSTFSNQPLTQYVCIDQDDTADSVLVKLKPISKQTSLVGFSVLARHTGYAENIHTGRYAVEPGMSTFSIFRHIKNGQQTPINLTVPSVRTLGRMAAELGKHLMADSTAIAQALSNDSLCSALGYDTVSIACIFIPNTYEVFWNISTERLLQRLKKENIAFWNDNRLRKAKQLELSPEEIVTLASIIDEETANNAEKPMIAGMYYNRLRLSDKAYPHGMPLQADPTVKFALGDFSLRRILHKHLEVESPYNTYKNTGLPPGPIRIPSVAGIDAVLNMVHHNYLYMCAKEDFSGTHNFAETYSEHQANARRYIQALNQRGIK